MLRSKSILPYLILSCLILHVKCLNLNDRCSNPDGDSGRCVHLRGCPPLREIYTKPVVTYQESSFLSDSRCGMDGRIPLVCCVSPDSETSTSAPGGDTCGVDYSERIWGGNETDLDEFPWTALIRYRRTNGVLTFNCGGSLINSRYVITAAHCFNERPGIQVAGVRLGEHTISNEGKDCQETECADVPVDRNIEKITVHEDYDANSKNQLNDIALVRMDRDVPSSHYIQPICLPTQESLNSRNIIGHRLTAAGWGRTESGDPSDTKLKVVLEITEPNGCNTVYKPAGIVISDRQLCAGGEKGKDTCTGDSGGPLMQRVGTRWVLYGIVSFGPKLCARKGIPGVYTNVPKYIDWIESNVEV
ncbi:hypothetical protein pipiens_005477 [Culex pipiens pipiens]|uniref:CLIP domain-containing serine protease n=1 Tax=Culex pipiens pipiens TaxID=38569 RepID=A0ABD1DWB2_CULPP